MMAMAYWLLAAHGAFCLLFFLFCRRRDSMRLRLLRLLVVFCMPAAGFAFLLLYRLLCFVPYRPSRTLEQYYQSLTEKKPLAPAREDGAAQKIDVVPAREALIFNRSDIRRRMMIYLAQKNTNEHLAILKQALKNEDTEVSHYAAAAISEISNYLLDEVRRKSVLYEEDAGSVSGLKNYVDALRACLESGLLTARMRQCYLQIYLGRLDDLLSVYQEEEKYFVDMINAELNEKNFTAAMKSCGDFQRAFPENEKPYFMRLKLFYLAREPDRLKETLRELRRSAISFSSPMLSVYRFWAGPAEEETR